MKNYIQACASELRNVTWPTRKQAVHSMALVLTIMLIVGVFLGFVDYLFSEGLKFSLESVNS